MSDYLHPFDDAAQSLPDLASEVERAERELGYWRALRNDAINRRLAEGATWDQVQDEARVSRATVMAARRAGREVGNG
jgi:hypothetical protein